MRTYLKEIPSDTTILNLDASTQVLMVRLQLYTEEVLALRFDDPSAFCLRAGWQMLDIIERIYVADTGPFLSETVEALRADREAADNLMSFQAVDGEGNILLEVISPSVTVEHQAQVSP